MADTAPDYHAMKKDELIAQAHQQGLQFDENASRDDLIKLLAGVVEEEKAKEDSIPHEPVPFKVRKGKSKYVRKSDGEIYELEMHAADPLTGRTHRAFNEVHQWEGDERMFCRDFIRQDGQPLMPSS